MAMAGESLAKNTNQQRTLNLSELDEKKLFKTSTALSSSYDDHIRPILDAIDHLRQLKVMQEGIQLPTIVVVGDQSSGKSSVLESLARISLPRGQGICTRVPLIMRLQDDSSLEQPHLQLEYFKDKVVPTTESRVTKAIKLATEEIAGNGKGISNTPLTLVVRKRGVPDLTMVDLPGITRVPVQGQPDDIYEQISKIIKEYITPKESIILNVLSATVDFPTCESIRMSQQVDRKGERTLAVVTKVDKAPEGLLEKVTADDVNIGLGYVCVRNRIDNESYEDARSIEAELFKCHPLLSKIDKSIVGVPVLAQRLMQIQASSIAKSLPDIVKKINDKLSKYVNDLSEMPQSLSSLADAMRVFMSILGRAKESLRNILIREEYDEFPDDTEMHGCARIADMLNKFSSELTANCPTDGDMFLMEEIGVLGEAKGVGLPNFIPRSAFLTIMKKKVKSIAHTPQEFVEKVWSYIEKVVLRVFDLHSNNYPPLQSSLRRAAQNMIENARLCSYKFAKELIEMEMLTAYTSNPNYMKSWNDLMANQGAFLEEINHPSRSIFALEGFGTIEVCHLRQHTAVAEQAFDMRMRITAYWKCVLVRLVDVLALHVMHSIKKLVDSDLDAEIVNDLAGDDMKGFQRMLEESPSTAAKRERLKKSIELLNESKNVMANLIYRIAALGE